MLYVCCIFCQADTPAKDLKLRPTNGSKNHLHHGSDRRPEIRSDRLVGRNTEGVSLQASMSTSTAKSKSTARRISETNSEPTCMRNRKCDCQQNNETILFSTTTHIQTVGEGPCGFASGGRTVEQRLPASMRRW